MARRIITVTAPTAPATTTPATAPICDGGCGRVIPASDIKAYRAEVGRGYRGLPRCCADCADRWAAGDAETITAMGDVAVAS